MNLMLQNISVKDVSLGHFSWLALFNNHLDVRPDLDIDHDTCMSYASLLSYQ